MRKKTQKWSASHCFPKHPAIKRRHYGEKAVGYIRSTPTVSRYRGHLTFTLLPLTRRIQLIHLQNICPGVFASLICRNTNGTPRAFAASTHLLSRLVNLSGFGFPGFYRVEVGRNSCNQVHKRCFSLEILGCETG